MEVQAPTKIAYDPIKLSAVNTDTALELYYIGAQDYAECAVNASGDINLEHGADASSEVVDSTLGLPVTDETTGIIDVSETGATTYGGILDYVNKPGRNWRMRPMAVRRADISTDSLLVKTETQCNLAPVALLRDGDTAVQTGTYTFGARVTAGRLDGQTSDYGYVNKIAAIDAKATCTAGTGTGYDDGEGVLTGIYLVVYAINDQLKTQRRIYSKEMATATLLEQSSADWGGGVNDLAGKPGESLLVLIQNSGSAAATKITSPQLDIYAYREVVGGGRTTSFRISDM